MRLRQFVLAATELDPLVAYLEAVLGIEVGFRDPLVAEFGLRNAVMPIGDTFLEVVSPIAAEAPAKRFLDRRGDGAYMLILQSDRLDADRARLAKLGVRVVWKLDLEDIRGTHLHPRDVGGAILSIDDATPPASWHWGGPEWRQHVRTEVVKTIAAAELEGPDPDALAKRWSEILDLPVSRGTGGAREIRLDPGTVRFVEAAGGRSEGLRGFDVEVADRGVVLERARARGIEVSGDELRLGGARLRLV